MLGFAASRFLKASSSRRYQSGDDRSSVGHNLDDATWATGAPSVSTPADNGSETPFTQADVVAPAAGSNPSATRPITPVTEPSDPFGSRRDPNPVP